VCKGVESTSSDCSGGVADCTLDVSLHCGQKGDPHAVGVGAGCTLFGILGFRTNERSPRDLACNLRHEFDRENAPFDSGMQVIRVDWINRDDRHYVRDRSENFSASHIEAENIYLQ
jgi:hypothetical protein